MAMIEAHIQKVEREVGSDWGSIFTDHETVKKLTTKRADLLTEAAGYKQSGVLVGIDFTEQVKRLDDGRTFRNYYYNGGGILHQASANGASHDDGIDVVQPTTRKTDPDDAWRMCLNKGGELAVGTLPMMPSEQRDFETQKTIARAWAEFFLFEPRPDGPGAAPQPSAASARHGAYTEPGGIEVPPPNDDIPF